MSAEQSLSLRWKIPLRVMATVLCTAITVTAALVAWEYDQMRRNIDDHAKSLGRILAKTLVSPVLHDDVWRSFEILQTAHETFHDAPELQAKVVLITDAEYKVFASTQPREFPIGSNPANRGGAFAEFHSRLSNGNAMTQHIIESPNSPIYYVMSPLVADGLAFGHVILGYSKTSFIPRFIDLATSATLITLLVLVVIAPIFWIGAGRTGKPLLRLADAMRRAPGKIEESPLDDIPKNGDEISQLTEAFQRMVVELKTKQALERQVLVSERLAAVGRLTTDIAHEINTPLGDMLTAIDTCQRHGKGNDSLALSTLSQLKHGLTQIRHTVSALMVESKPKDQPFASKDVDDLLILAEAEAHNLGVNIIAESNLNGALPLPATLTRQILLNLLLNAISTTKNGGDVHLVVKSTSKNLCLTITNNGDHIPHEHINTLFEPSPTNGEPDRGMGLWIVYQIVQQLAGEIEVMSVPGNTTFTVEIPYGNTIRRPCLVENAEINER